MNESTPLLDKKPGNWRTIRTAGWLGWQIESNWADPMVFGLYAILRPIMQASILIVMYLVIRGQDFTSPDFVNLYLGNAFYILVISAMQGVSFGILDDREHYRTLKYLYVAPIRMPMYLIGRGFASMAVSSLSVLVTILFGVIFLKMPFSLLEVNWGLFLVSLLLGLVAMTSLGILLGGWTLMVKNNPWALGEALAGGLFIFSGAVFPISLLPPVLEQMARFFPIGYWLVLIRRAVTPAIGYSYPMYQDWSDGTLLLTLAAFAAAYSALALIFYRIMDHHAREKGMIDMVSNY